MKRRISSMQFPCKNRQTETIANALLHRVCCLTGPPTKLSIDQDAALTSVIIKEMLTSLECTMQIISPWNHGSSKAERQIQTIGNMINKHLTQKGASWPFICSSQRIRNEYICVYSTTRIITF